MFREFRDAWRQTVDNFWRELEGDPASEGGGPNSRAAFREVARVRNQLDRLTQEIDGTHQRLGEEREQVEVCARRERMARDIGDGETAQVAARYRQRHQERADVLARKLEALEAEHRLCVQDLEEMERALGDRLSTDEREQLDDLNRHPKENEFRTLEDLDRSRSADERLEELKRRMGR